MHTYVKWGLIAGAAYVGFKLLSGAKLSELLKIQSTNKGSEGKGATQTVGGKTYPTIGENKTSSSTGVAVGGGDGSAGFTPAGSSTPLLDKYLGGDADGGGPVAPGNPFFTRDWLMQ
jgi:hypothetical protein